jgi:Ion transport protein
VDTLSASYGITVAHYNNETLINVNICLCTDANDDLKWKLALCTVTVKTAKSLSPMRLVVKLTASHIASLMLKVVAKAWNTGVIADTIYMPDLIALLLSFPTLAVPFLTDHIKLVQTGERFHLRRKAAYAAGFAPQWVRAAVSLQAFKCSSEMDRDYAEYMTETFPTGLRDFIIESAAIYMTSSKTSLFRDTHEHVRAFVQQAIPVRNCNTTEVLKVAVAIAEFQQSALMFKSEVLAAVTHLHWHLYGRADHIFSLLIYILLLALFTLLIVMFDTWVTTSTSLKTLAWVLQGIKCIIFTSYFVVQEYRELLYEGFQVWVWDAWNIMDVTAYGLIYAGVIVQACSDHEHPAHSKAANMINAIAAVLLWFKLLHYMRPYKATGVLVSMIFKILMKIRAFMLVLAIVVVGFATAFYSVLNTDKASSNNASVLKYNTVGNALRTSFSYMLGTYELAVLDVGPSDVMLSILWAVFSVIVSILLLNILIAIISHNFEKLYETSEHSYVMEKTKVVILSNIKLSNKRKAQLGKLLTDMPYVVVFKPHEYTEETADKRKDRIDIITTAVSGSVDKLQADVSSVKADVEGVSTEVTALKQEVSDLKSIIQDILRVVNATAQQISAASTADTDEYSVSETAPTPLESIAAAAAATEEPTLGTRSGTAAVATSTS